MQIAAGAYHRCNPLNKTNMKNNVSLKAMTLFTGLFITCTWLTGQTPDTCYKAVKETNSVWRIVENNSVNIYVVEGKDSALIIDTGYGTGDLKSYTQGALLCKYGNAQVAYNPKNLFIGQTE